MKTVQKALQTPFRRDGLGRRKLGRIWRSSRCYDGANRERRAGDQPLTLAWFLRWQIFVPDAAFEQLLPFLSQHRAAVDELALYDTPGNAWFPFLETCSKGAVVMARRFKSFRNVGIKSLGVTLINVIGSRS
jgi:hypothetical protein